MSKTGKIVVYGLVGYLVGAVYKYSWMSKRLEVYRQKEGITTPSTGVDPLNAVNPSAHNIIPAAVGATLGLVLK